MMTPETTLKSQGDGAIDPKPGPRGKRAISGQEGIGIQKDMPALAGAAGWHFRASFEAGHNFISTRKGHWGPPT